MSAGGVRWTSGKITGKVEADLGGNCTRGATGVGSGGVAATAATAVDVSAGAAMTWRGGDRGAQALRAMTKAKTPPLYRSEQLKQALVKTFKGEAII